MSIGVSGVIHLIGHIFIGHIFMMSSFPFWIEIHFNLSENLVSIGVSGDSLNWTYLYDADGFLQFRVLNRVLELFRSEWVLRFIYFNKFQHFVDIEGEC